MSRRAERTPEPILLPRGLIFLASLWLMASWMISIGVTPPVQPSAASYMPSVRIMIFSIGLGIGIGWPLLRLSEGTPTTHPLRRALLDLVVLAALIQVVVWPLRLVTTWNLERTFIIDATLVLWAMIFGAVIASAGRSGSAGRTLAMVLCILLGALGFFTAALLAVAGVPGNGLLPADVMLRVGALTSLHTLTGGEPGPVGATEWQQLMILSLAAALAWATAALVNAAARPGRTRTSEQGGPGAAEPVS